MPEQYEEFIRKQAYSTDIQVYRSIYQVHSEGLLITLV